MKLLLGALAIMLLIPAVPALDQECAIQATEFILQGELNCPSFHFTGTTFILPEHSTLTTQNGIHAPNINLQNQPNCQHAAPHGTKGGDITITATHIQIHGTIKLGNGGNGGNITGTGPNCNLHLTAGNGGASGLLIINNQITTKYTNHIQGGEGGNGGNINATAHHGENGTLQDPNGESLRVFTRSTNATNGEPGKSIEAYAGNGGLGLIVGGRGGNAIAFAGDGGRGHATNTPHMAGGNGGRGGYAIAVSGHGGDSYTLSPGSSGSPTARAGDGGNGGESAGNGGTEPSGPGGEGGQGGDAYSFAQAPGFHPTIQSSVGRVIASPGTGGNGGDSLGTTGTGGMGGPPGAAYVGYQLSPPRANGNPTHETKPGDAWFGAGHGGSSPDTPAPKLEYEPILDFFDWQQKNDLNTLPEIQFHENLPGQQAGIGKHSYVLYNQPKTTNEAQPTPTPILLTLIATIWLARRTQ